MLLVLCYADHDVVLYGGGFVSKIYMTIRVCVTVGRGITMEEVG